MVSRETDDCCLLTIHPAKPEGRPLSNVSLQCDCNRNLMTEIFSIVEIINTAVLSFNAHN